MPVVVHIPFPVCLHLGEGSLNKLTGLSPKLSESLENGGGLDFLVEEGSNAERERERQLP